MSLRRALAIEQKLVELNPTATGFRRVLVQTYTDLGLLQAQTGHPEEALDSLGRALEVRQKLADDNAVRPAQRNALAALHTSIADIDQQGSAGVA